MALGRRGPLARRRRAVPAHAWGAQVDFGKDPGQSHREPTRRPPGDRHAMACGRSRASLSLPFSASSLNKKKPTTTSHLWALHPVDLGRLAVQHHGLDRGDLAVLLPVGLLRVALGRGRRLVRRGSRSGRSSSGLERDRLPPAGRCCRRLLLLLLLLLGHRRRLDRVQRRRCRHLGDHDGGGSRRMERRALLRKSFGFVGRPPCG